VTKEPQPEALEETGFRDDFCVFVLSHNRPDRVPTLGTLARAGYTGKAYIVVDDEDENVPEYQARYGDSVIVFSRQEAAKITDGGDNVSTRGVVYARNMCWTLAKQVGCRYFMVLDDDYSAFFIRYGAEGEYMSRRIRTTMNQVIEALLEFFIASGAYSIAMSQGGDWVGGAYEKTYHRKLTLSRKVMNSFICDAEKPFKFYGRINEDVNAYVLEGLRGKLFFTVLQTQLVQKQTQANSGGLTELYLDVGTYQKSFYSVMYAPASVKISTLADSRSPHPRIHHVVDWNRTAPLILREEHRNTNGGSAEPADPKEVVPLFTKAGGVPGGHMALGYKGKKPHVANMGDCHALPLRHTDVVADVGAYVGTYSLWCARHPVREVRAFEPTPRSADLIADVSHPNLTLYRAAVVGDEKTKTVDLYLSKRLGLTNSVAQTRAKAGKITVDAISYEEAVRGATVAKIDVEGAEYSYPIVQPSLRGLIIDFHPMPGDWKKQARLIMEEIRDSGFRAIREPEFKHGWDVGGVWAREVDGPGEVCEPLMKGSICCGCGAPIAADRKALCRPCAQSWAPRHRRGFALGELQ